MAPSHPYYPQDLDLPGFQPAALKFEVILAIAFGGIGAVFLAGWLMSGLSKRLQLSERLWVAWFLTTGVIHLVLEGSVVARSKFFEDATGDIVNEIWKEYSKADSRYVTRDAFTIEMEFVTSYIEGPACFLIVFGILYSCSWRYSAMLLVSLGQLYGDVLYYMTCWHVGWHKYSRPEPLYFWFYFVFINSIWIVVPLTCIIYTANRINACVAAAGSAGKRKKF